MPQTGQPASPAGFTARRTLVVVGIVALALVLWQIRDALLLLFMGILFAVFLRGAARLIADRLHLSMGWSLVVIWALMIGLGVAGTILLGPTISRQATELSETLPESIDQAEQSLRDTAWGERLLEDSQSGSSGLRLGGNVFGRLSGVASGLMSFLTNVVFILFTAIFLAAKPTHYRDGLVLLVPSSRTDRVREALNAAGHALGRWMIGKLVAMVFVGVFTTIGLLIVGVPLALVLGLVAGLLDFVPFVGPIVAAVPGVLLALTLGPTKALYAALVYLLAQQIEGNVITPLIQQKEVSLPPVLVLFAVIAAGLLFGILGIIVATPLMVVVMVLTKMLYVQDALGKDVEVPGT